MVGMELVAEKFVVGDIPRFSDKVKVIDREEDIYKEILLVEKEGQEYIIAIKYLPAGDDGGFAAMVWKAKTVRKHGATREDLFDAIEEALHLISDDLKGVA